MNDEDMDYFDIGEEYLDADEDSLDEGGIHLMRRLFISINYRKRLIQHYELRLHFEWTKVVHLWGVFENLKVGVKKCY